MIDVDRRAILRVARLSALFASMSYILAIVALMLGCEVASYVVLGIATAASIDRLLFLRRMPDHDS